VVGIVEGIIGPLAAVKRGRKIEKAANVDGKKG